MSPNNSKIVHYGITDPAVLAWYSLASVHRVRWRAYEHGIKDQIISTHSGRVFEQFVRDSLPGAQRYWNSNTEIDLVLSSGKECIIGEIKWAKLAKGETSKLLATLQRKLTNSAPVLLSSKGQIILKIYDQSFLKSGEAVVSEAYRP